MKSSLMLQAKEMIRRASLSIRPCGVRAASTDKCSRRNSERCRAKRGVGLDNDRAVPSQILSRSRRDEGKTREASAWSATRADRVALSTTIRPRATRYAPMWYVHRGKPCGGDPRRPWRRQHSWAATLFATLEIWHRRRFGATGTDLG